MGQVSPAGRERNGGREIEAAANLAVEQAREDGRGIEIRQAQPVDRAVARDERRGAAITDEGVVANRGVPVDAFDGRRAQKVGRGRAVGHTPQGLIIRALPAAS